MEKAIWKVQPDIAEMNLRCKNTIMESLGIKITEVGHNFVVGTMPVDHRTHQPLGLLHGGASVTLAETLGSFAANLALDTEKEFALGLEINANHIRSVKSGIVIGTATNAHLGSKTQIWEIKITDTDGRLVCISRLTMAVLPR